MKVYKFGGTSVGTADRLKALLGIVGDGTTKLVVLSAMSGTTNDLVRITKHLYNQELESAKKVINELESRYKSVVQSLFSTAEGIRKGDELIQSHFQYLRSFTKDLFTIYEERAILAQGELLSTALFHYYLNEQNVQSHLISALNFMRTDKDGEPDKYYIKENLTRELKNINSIDGCIIITQGYICRNAFGEIDNLKRGGSDYSATLMGEALNAEEIQIWTDIDGIHNNDPRVVENTNSISTLSFDEAAELAYFGAKILHPSSLHPAKIANVPVRLKNTMDPKAEGTLITIQSSSSGIKAIAAKDEITAIKIKSGRMLLAYGFLRKVFEIFETYKTSIDMITTSEVAISVTIDETDALEKIVADIENYGSVEVDKNQSIICVVGNFIADNSGLAGKIFAALDEIPIRMISYGGSKHNITVLVDQENKKKALIALGRIL